MYQEQFTRIHIGDGQIPEFPLHFLAPGISIRKYRSYVNRYDCVTVEISGECDHVIVPMFECPTGDWTDEHIEANCKWISENSPNAEPRENRLKKWKRDDSRVIVFDNRGRMGFAIL